MFKITLEEALTIQAEQCAHYEQFAPGITEVVAAHTDTSGLSHNGEYDVVFMNKRVPRGGRIEQLAGLFEQMEG